MSHEWIALLMFSSMMLMLLTGQRVFGAIGFVAAMAALPPPPDPYHEIPGGCRISLGEVAGHGLGFFRHVEGQVIG